jgi:hypothetical protein
MRPSLGCGALFCILLLASCGGDQASSPAEPNSKRGTATTVHAVHLEALPEAGVAVASSEAVMLVDLDGTVVTTLQGYEIAGNPGAPGVWLQRGSRYFKLKPIGGELAPVPKSRARDVMYREGPEPSLPAPEAAIGSDGDVAGHWRYAVGSPSGSATLAQWSGECEVPTAFWIDDNGTSRIVTGGSDLAAAPESLGLGWAQNERAVVFLPNGACASSADAPGIYLYSSPGAAELVYQTEDGLRADSWGLGL